MRAIRHRALRHTRGSEISSHATGGEEFSRFLGPSISDKRDDERRGRGNSRSGFAEPLSRDGGRFGQAVSVSG